MSVQIRLFTCTAAWVQRVGIGAEASYDRPCMALQVAHMRRKASLCAIIECADISHAPGAQRGPKA
jgi:hypothetical protein